MTSPVPEYDYHIPIVHRLNHFVKVTCEMIAWVNVLLVAVIMTQVILRYGFNSGMVLLEELMWHLYAIGFMFGLSYAMVNDSHIRVDLVHMHLSRSMQHVWEIFGIVVFLLPFLIIIGWQGLEWTLESYRLNESSSDPTGLPYRWAIKAVIPLSFLLLTIAAISRLIQEVMLLMHYGKEVDDVTPGQVSMMRHLFQVQSTPIATGGHAMLTPNPSMAPSDTPAKSDPSPAEPTSASSMSSDNGGAGNGN